MNDEARMTKDRRARDLFPDFVILVSFVIRHSSFDIPAAPSVAPLAA
jgi:hypothetical protein